MGWVLQQLLCALTFPPELFAGPFDSSRLELTRVSIFWMLAILSPYDVLGSFLTLETDRQVYAERTYESFPCTAYCFNTIRNPQRLPIGQ